MKILFVHPNFPAQFRHVASHFGRGKSNVVVYACNTPQQRWSVPGVSRVKFSLGPSAKNPLPSHLNALDMNFRHGAGMYHTGYWLKKNGFTPDVIYAHSGWGSTLFLKDIWPDTPLLCYFEWFYDPAGADATFGQPGQHQSMHMSRMRNGSIFNDLWACDQGVSPTRWQHSQFPKEYQHKIKVLHDGVNTDFFTPAPEQKMVLPGLDLSSAKEIVTFAGRGLEPYRGFPVFMKAAEILQDQRKNLHIVVAGKDRVCYGPSRSDGKTWKEHALAHLKLDPDRIHFTGAMPYIHYRTLLQAGTAHVYLTRPFVLSWSCIEAMACGCALIASDTPPVMEVLQHKKNALLCDFFNAKDVAEKITEVLENKTLARQLRTHARQTAVENYSLAALLPKHLNLIARTAARPLA